MTEQEALSLRKQLEEHYGQPVMPVDEYCRKFDQFFALKEVQAHLGEEGMRHVQDLRMFAIGKSCLLHRMVYCGEEPSTVPCPVHKGKWSGCHFGWPGQKWSNGKLVEESKQCREWYDAGCCCFQHACGCTTGWQPSGKKE